jgi:hypothetical protein
MMGNAERKKEITVLWLQRLVFITGCKQDTNLTMTYWDFGHHTYRNIN